MTDDHAKMDGLRKEIEDAKTALLGGGDESALLFDTAGSPGPCNANAIKVRRTLKGHFGKVYAMHWAGSSDPHKLVTASQDGKLIVWNGNTTNKQQAIPLRSSWVMTCAFETGGNTLVACGGLDNLCSIYNAGMDADNNSAKAEKELAHHDGYLSCCRFVSESEIITSSGDSTCILWDVNTQQPKTHYQKHTSDVMSIALSPDNPNIFVSGSCDATCIAWDMRTSSVINVFRGHESDINSVSFFPDGKCFGTGSDDSSCKLFDTRCFNMCASMEADKILCGVTSVTFTKSGRFMFAGYDDYTMGIWDTLGQNRDVARMSHHENRVSCIGTESTGRAVCSGSWDTILKCWA